MKKIIFSLAVLVFVTNCVLIDSLGLNVTHATIKGSEAKNLILTNALAGAALSGAAGTSVATAIVTYNTKGIKDSKFYDKDDVDACANNVLAVNYAAVRSTGVAPGDLGCGSIREHKMIIDWPVPLL
ncbi:MAG TPA: TIGR04452 family lipoprotein [Leptospiraceae bacterium]|nr:TIGR04452 family lipoprotein [Leptospiraceae bacterium]HMW06802.1 TIGR04452 family lipoprotein [Leptospiraceae bacterium]HMX32182.1 TIGR04452 family lipoprotein [Leptospiraceae bacterium]HMY32252.1 TIGR04452 family lipoprotein [Leptospiraceae bacterium]HMZ63941.1 TIGR04452 family lipoprotein [Leptospiraceae bacterium]